MIISGPPATLTTVANVLGQASADLKLANTPPPTTSRIVIGSAVGAAALAGGWHLINRKASVPGGLLIAVGVLNALGVLWMLNQRAEIAAARARLGMK